MATEEIKKLFNETCNLIPIKCIFSKYGEDMTIEAVKEVVGQIIKETKCEMEAFWQNVYQGIVKFLDNDEDMLIANICFDNNFICKYCNETFKFNSIYVKDNVLFAILEDENKHIIEVRPLRNDTFVYVEEKVRIKILNRVFPHVSVALQKDVNLNEAYENFISQLAFYISTKNDGDYNRIRSHIDDIFFKSDILDVFNRINQ